MIISPTFANQLLLLIFNAENIANVADNAGTDPITNLYVALHSTDPNAGDQSTGEVVYTGYGRVAVVRSSAGWTVTANSVANNGAITFGACTGGTDTANFASIGKEETDPGEIFYSGPVDTPLPIGPGVTPEFAAGVLLLTVTP